MSDRFIHDIQDISPAGAPVPLTSHRRLLKQLGLIGRPEEEQRAAVQAWIDRRAPSSLSEELVLSLEFAGFKFPTAAGLRVHA